jgi:hypothetical protein
MNEHDVMYQVRESFSGLRMDTPVETVLARSSARRRRRLAGLTATTAGAAGAAAVMALTLGGSAPAPGGSAPPPASHSPSVSPGSLKLAAFSVADGPGGSTTLILYRYAPLDPTALRQALAQHGIPALVTVGTFCRSNPGVSGLDQVAQPSTQADGSDVIAINGQAMPPGTELSIGIFPDTVRMLLIEEGVPLSCSSTADQPGNNAVHDLPTGAPIRG